MKVHLGFESNPYSGVSSYVGKRSGRSYGEGKNSAQVAKELEQRYSIVETFVEMEDDFITSLIEDAFIEEVEEIVEMSRLTKRTKGISDENTDKIEARFRRNIAMRRYDGLIPGVPTLASLRGVSHLRKHPYVRRATSRPSFRDTGNYVNSFRAWTED